MNSYTLDTNILIGLKRHYPREHFVGVWDRLEELVAAGRACICGMVLEELGRGGDDLHSWAKTLDGFVHDPNSEEFQTVGQITAEHPGRSSLLTPRQKARSLSPRKHCEVLAPSTAIWVSRTWPGSTVFLI